MTRPETLTNTHLLVIVLAQFAGTSLWFAGNAILPDLQPLLGTNSLNGWITSAVQLGFITGSLSYTFYAIPDRFPATRVFLISVVAAAAFNLLFLVLPLRSESVLLSRFGTGFFLAGVYPVGMKIAADWFRPMLGRAMGFLVGALVLGTALPHLIRGLGSVAAVRGCIAFGEWPGRGRWAFAGFSDPVETCYKPAQPTPLSGLFVTESTRTASGGSDWLRWPHVGVIHGLGVFARTVAPVCSIASRLWVQQVRLGILGDRSRIFGLCRGWIARPAVW